MNVRIGVVTDIDGALDAIERLTAAIREDAQGLAEQLEDAQGERDTAQRRVEELEDE